MTIGFLTPYKHLPRFTKFVESKYKCVDLKDSIQKVDIIFSAPNYDNCTVTEDLVNQCNARYIVSPSTGTNHIYVKSIPTIDIKNDPVLDTIPSTAEHNIYLILSLIRNANPVLQLADLSLGILGYGRLGKMLDSKCFFLFNDILHMDIHDYDNEFFTDTDVLSINIDLREENVNFINEEFINKFNKNIFIVNTSRGEVVNEEDVLKLIESGKVLGYATDVVKEEYNDLETPLKLANQSNTLIITPHVGGIAIGAQESAYRRSIEKLKEL